MDKLSKGKSNFENVLASQSCVFGKAGLSFNPQNQQDKFSIFFKKVRETTGCYMLLLHEEGPFG